MNLKVNHGNFDFMSIYCYHHGYMGGENLLIYTNIWEIKEFQINNQTINFKNQIIETFLFHPHAIAKTIQIDPV